MNRVYDHTNTIIDVITDEEMAQNYADKRKAAEATPRKVSQFTLDRIAKLAKLEAENA